jgi:hypothetical protein
MSTEEAADRFWVVDQHGLMGKGREELSMHQALFMREDMADETSLIDVVKEVSEEGERDCAEVAVGKECVESINSVESC